MRRLTTGSAERGSLLVLAIALLAACATPPQEGHAPGLVIVPTGNACLDTTPAARRKVKITNHTGHAVQFLTWTNRQPFLLYGHSHDLDIVDAASGKRSPYEVTLDEFIGPRHRVTLEDGDSSLFAFEPVGWPQAGDASTFYIVIRDADFDPYDSMPLKVCGQG